MRFGHEKVELGVMGSLKGVQISLGLLHALPMETVYLKNMLLVKRASSAV